MNYSKLQNQSVDYIKHRPLSEDDLNLIFDFLENQEYFDKYFRDGNFFLKNRTQIVEDWFYFLQNKVPAQITERQNAYSGTIYRATFGEAYTLEQLAASPLHYSAGSNGTGLYAVTNDGQGKHYIKMHLLKKFSKFDQKTGNIIKVKLAENATVLDKTNIFMAQRHFVENILNLDIQSELKSALISFLSSDVSIPALLLGADVMYIPNGHVVVLNKNALAFPANKEDFENSTLRIDLEKYRNHDKHEQQKADEFLQK